MIIKIARRFTQSLRGDRFSRLATAVSVASVALGSMALIVSVSILQGYEDAIERTALQFTADIEVKPRFGGTLAHPAVTAAAVALHDGIVAVDRVLAREALVRGNNVIDGVMLVGMSPDRLNRLMMPLIVRGELIVPDNEVMIGSGLARRLSVGPGDTLLVYSSDEQHTTPRIFQSRVGAVIECGMTSYDESVVVFNRHMLAHHLRVDSGSASSLLLTCEDRSSLVTQQRELQQRLGNNVIVYTYRDSFATVSSWIELQREPIPIILGLISLVAGLTMVSTMLIAVIAKSRSIAILVTLGLSPVRAGLIFVTRAVTLSAVGSLIGLVAASVLLLIQDTWHPVRLDGALYYVSTLPVSFPVAPYLVVPASSIVLALVVGLAPMFIAMRVRPAQALRFD